MKRWTRRFAVLGAIALIVVALRLTVFQPEPEPVTVFRVERDRVEDTVVNSRAGAVESRRRARMSPGTSGLVASIPVHKGDAVVQGQVLLRLDDAEYQAQVRLADRSVDAAKAARTEACLAADQAERDRVRGEALNAQSLISETRLETLRTESEMARARCESARERVMEAQASLAAARAILAKTVMVAPFDGVVLDVTTEVGEWISPSPPGVFIPPVLDLIDPNTLYVTAPLDEADIARVQVGLPVRISLEAFRDRTFAGTLTYVSSYVETRQEQNRTLTVEAEFALDPLPSNLLAGISSDIEVIIRQQDDVLRIPTYALLEGNRVLVVRDDVLESVPVSLGLRNWDYLEITDGLAEGDPVVVSLDRAQVKAGARVRIEGDTP